MLLQVVALSPQAERIISITLRSPVGAELPAWRPGAHIDVTLPTGLIRQYSLCGSPSDTKSYSISVLREGGGRGGSMFIHDKLAAGNVLDVGAPRNNFALEAAQRYIFIAGGIGITPIVAMVRQLVGGAAEWELFYGGRTRTSMAFLEELQPYADRARIFPQDEKGGIPMDVALAKAADALIYCCGPTTLIHALESRCAAVNLTDRLRVERFVPDTLTSGGAGCDSAFTAVIASSGKEISVAADTTLLAALVAEGVDIAFSCEEGTCGTCETRILSGQADHRDSILNAAQRAANDRMMVCVSRANGGKLVLDL